MLRAIELQHIRSYDNGLFEFADGVNIVVGPNASGKTNLLEAIFMMARGTGFRSNDHDMVQRDSTWGRIDAALDSGTRTVKLTLDPPTKLFTINDIDKKRLSAATMLPVVLFEPNHMLLLGGEPERRRSYIDGILTQLEPRFSSALASYKRALAQRNRLLKQDLVSPEHLFVWDIRLSELGGVLARYRSDHVQKINDVLADVYGQVSGGTDRLEIFYDSRLPIETYTEAHLQKLQADFELDRLRGFTGSGPHRDDIGVLLSGNEARLSASRGESRSIVLSLKILELQHVHEVLERKPLLLLDDVFSELDGRRRRLLAQAIEDVQTFITTTDADAILKSYIGKNNIIATSST